MTSTSDTAMVVPTLDLPTGQLENEITALAGQLAAATCRWLGLIAEFDRREGWRLWEQTSCAGWLSWQCGVSLTTAHEHVRVARALQCLPLARAAFAAGRLSYSKVRAISRVATPGDEDGWVSAALGATAAQLDRLVRACIKVTRDESEQRVGREKTAWRYDDEGMLVLTARLAPERGARVVAALERMRRAAAGGREHGAEMSDDPGEAQTDEHAGTCDGSSSAEDSEQPHEDAGWPHCRLSDALVAMADAAASRDLPPHSGGDSYAVVIHVEQRALARTSSAARGAEQPTEPSAEGYCHVADGPSIHPETLRRETCAGGAALTVHEGRDGTPLDAGRTSRSVPARLRRAVYERAGRRCQYPGCERKAWLQIHHVTHWVDGGPTSYANLCVLCSTHHRSHHAGRYTITHDRVAPGGFRFALSDGTAVPSVPTAPVLAGDLTDHYVGPVAAGGVCPEAYDRLNLDYAVAVMAGR